MKLLKIEDIINAGNRIGKLINKTPVYTSSLLNKWIGHEIYFKAECMQKIGAFKARGAANSVAWLIENGKKPRHIVANSSGNHAQAVAWAASEFDIPSTIYMPVYSSKIKIQATQAYGAKTVLCNSRVETDDNVKSAASEEGNYWLHPFNSDLVIAGQGTAAYEAINELGQVDAIFAPCGGGGLLSGTVIASHGLDPDIKVIGAEPLNANDAARSLRANSILNLDSVPDTLADGAMTMSVGSITFEYLKKLDDMYEIDEQSIVYWTQWLTHLLKISIEPTSAMSMEAARQWLKTQPTPKKILIIISGGNIDQEMQMKIWKENHLEIIPGLIL
ncbi:MAG: serine/threonine dehydratase [Deltaproteobacteria bacterium]